MRTSQLKRRLIAGVIVCGLLAFFLGRLSAPDSSPRWRNLRDGMTQNEVRQALGGPTWMGKTSTTGAGGEMVARWQYRRYQLGRWVYYCVDFDYIGPGGAPLVFRTERYSEEWEWPSWWPWPQAKARA